MSTPARTVELLQASVDESDESYFRLLVDGTVRYVTVAAGLYAATDLCFAPTLLSLLPPFPNGDWNEGHIAWSVESNAPIFEWTATKELPTIRNCWHSTFVDHLDISFGQKLRSGVYEVTSSKFKLPIVAKFARFAWEIPAHDCECLAYQWIEGHDIGPKFLGFLTEAGRVIGFLIERISDARHATPDDLPLCQNALARLHDIGVLHGDVNKHNFLIKDDRAVLIDFEAARRNHDESAFKEEMEQVRKELYDTSGKGGSIRVG